MRRLNAIKAVVAVIDVEQYYGEEDLWMAMEELIEVLEGKLKKADKRRPK
jgi:hypothetical protein